MAGLSPFFHAVHVGALFRGLVQTEFAFEYVVLNVQEVDMRRCNKKGSPIFVVCCAA